MFTDIYVMEYAKAIFVFVVSIFLIKAIFSGKLIIDPKKIHSSKRKFVKEHVKKLNIVARIFMLIMVIAGLLFIVIPAIMDFDGWLKKDFKIMKCVTTSKNDDQEKNYKNRIIQLINIDTGEKSELTLEYKAIEVGEYYTVEYLPNMKIGKVISKDK